MFVKFTLYPFLSFVDMQEQPPPAYPQEAYPQTAYPPPQPMAASQQQVIVMAQPTVTAAPIPQGKGYPQKLNGWHEDLFGCFDDIGSCEYQLWQRTSY